MHGHGGVHLRQPVLQGGDRPRPRPEQPAERPLPAPMGGRQVVVQVVAQGLPIVARQHTKNKKKETGRFNRHSEPSLLFFSSRVFHREMLNGRFESLPSFFRGQQKPDEQQRRGSILVRVRPPHPTYQRWVDLASLFLVFAAAGGQEFFPDSHTILILHVCSINFGSGWVGLGLE